MLCRFAVRSSDGEGSSSRVCIYSRAMNNAAYTVNKHTLTHTFGVWDLPEADCGEGGEGPGGEGRSHGQRSRGADVVLTARDIIYIYIYIYMAATGCNICARVCAGVCCSAGLRGLKRFTKRAVQFEDISCPHDVAWCI